MPSVIDAISSFHQKNHFAQWGERTADYMLAPFRSWGFGHHYTVIKLNGEKCLNKVKGVETTAWRVISLVLFPLVAIATLFGVTAKLILKEACQSLKEKYTLKIVNRKSLEFSKIDTIASKTIFEYPQAKRIDHEDDYHGVKVPDPYRWLEDASSAERKEWINNQVKLSNAYFSNIPQRKEIHGRLTRLWNYEKCGKPFKAGERYFWFKNDGLQNQSVLYTSDTYDGKPEVLLDPNTFSKDGTTALSDCEASEDGKLLAYSYSEGGSDWVTIKVRDIETGNDLEDTLKWVKFSAIAWTKDSKGFFYSRYDAPEDGKALQASNKHHKLYYHELGKTQEHDVLIYDRKDEEDWLFDADLTEDGKYLLIYVSDGCKRENGLFIKDLSKPESPIIELFNAFDASYSCIGNEGEKFWFVTNHGANNKRVITLNLSQPESEHWTEVVPETENILTGANIVGDLLFVKYLQDAHSVVKIYQLDGTFAHDLKLPGIGSASGFGGKQNDTETFFSFTNHTTPSTVYRYHIATGETTAIRPPKVDFNPADFTTKQIFYKSKDGTVVPMFISHKKDIVLDGSNPTLLYGYGGFNHSITPGFSVSKLVWMEKGGVYCEANIRGGGEYGKKWHEEGMKLNKQNVFDDFIAAGRWLVENGYTEPSKLAIMGGSNGGLLVGACLNQAPELFGAGIACVGVMDMLRFNQFTIGKAWESDYGSPQDPEEFDAIHAYSPYHQINKEKEYPAVLVTTSDHDDRVVPLHSYKYGAMMQWAKKEFGEKPAIVRIATNTGHGAGRSTTERINEHADHLAFLMKNLN